MVMVPPINMVHVINDVAIHFQNDVVIRSYGLFLQRNILKTAPRFTVIVFFCLYPLGTIQIMGMQM